MSLRDLLESLEQHPVPVLRAIAAGHDLDVTKIPREDLPRTLASFLADPQTVASTLDRLTDEERAVLDRLIAEGGALPAHRVQREYGEVRELGAGRLERERPWEDPISPTERLWYFGVIYASFGVLGEFRGRVYYVPSDLLALLPEVEEPPVRFEVEAVTEPAETRSAEMTLVEDAFTVLSELQQHPSSVVRDRFLPAETLERINGRLKIPEPSVRNERETQRLGLLLHLLRELDLIDINRDEHVAPVARRARRWLQLPRGRRLQTLQRAWAGSETWNDLWHVPELRFERTGWRNDPLATRRRVISWLKEVPVGSWVSIESFVQAVKRVDPDFQRPTGDYESWYIRDAATGEFLQGWESWDDVEGGLLRYLLRGPLLWLDVVTVGYYLDDEPEAVAFRITPRGAHFLGHDVELPSPPQREPVRIHPDGTVTVPANVNDWERLHLERLSVPVEPPRRYRIDRERLTNVLVEGSDPQRILRFLQHITDDAVPEDVVREIRSWVSGFGKLTIRRLVTLEVDTPNILTDLRRLPDVNRYIVGTLNQNVVIVDSDHVDDLVAALRAAGYLPKVADGDTLNE